MLQFCCEQLNGLTRHIIANLELSKLDILEYFTISVVKAYQHPVFIFLLKAALLYGLWFLLYDLWLVGLIDNWVIQNSIYFTGKLLTVLGHEMYTHGRVVGLTEFSGLWIGNSCNGVPLFALFSGFIIAYPGQWLRKLWFIPLGVMIIHFLNILRIAALVLIQGYAPDSLDFNHTYTFTLFDICCHLWALDVLGQKKD